MVRDYQKKTERSNISEPQMKQALVNIFNKNMSLRAAARAHNIKRSTLQSRRKTILKSMTAEEFLQKYDDDGYDSEMEKMGKYATRNVFSTAQEEMLESYIKQCSNMNYGLTYAQIRSLAFDYAKILPDCKYPLTWNECQKAGKDWLLGFMKRHPGLSLRKPESTSLARGLGFNKTKVDEFFENYKTVLKKYKFSPDRIYNLDETGVTTVLTPPKVVAQKGKKQVALVASAERGELVTFVGIINATGHALPPVYIFPRIRNIEDYLSDAPSLSVALGNKSGWMTKELFIKTLEHVVKHTECSRDNKILMLLDNHESHTSLEAINFAREHGVVMLSFPPHTSHKLQPLDVGVYGPFKSKCSVALNEWMISNPGKTLSVKQIPKITKQPFLDAFSPRNITSAFEKPGIWPLNSLAFVDEDFDATLVYKTDAKEKSSTMMESQNETPNQPSTSKENVVQNLCVGALNAKEDNIDNNNLPSTSEEVPVPTRMSPKILSPECVRPFPKVEKSDGTKKKTKKANQGKSRIYTETPEKQRLEELHNAKLSKEKLKEEKEKGKLKRKSDKLQTKKAKVQKIKRKVFDESSSEESENNVYLDDTDDNESFESFQKDDEVCTNSYILVRFAVKTAFVYYVGNVVDKISDNKYNVKYLRRRGNSNKFYFPLIEDIATCDLSDIHARLTKYSKSRRDSTLTFYYNFEGMIVK